MDEARLRLEDPELSADELVRIATEHPELRSKVFMHPNCPSGLLVQILSEVPGPPAPTSESPATDALDASDDADATQWSVPPVPPASASPLPDSTSEESEIQEPGASGGGPLFVPILPPVSAEGAAEEASAASRHSGQPQPYAPGQPFDYEEDDDQPRRRGGAALAIVLVAVIAIVAVVFAGKFLLGGGTQRTAPDAAAEAPGSSSTEDAEEDAGESSEDEGDQRGEDKPKEPLPSEAYQGARGPAPSGSLEPSETVSKSGLKIASIATPTGNIGCDIRLTDSSEDPDDHSRDSIICAVKSWKDDAPVAADPQPDKGTTPYVYLGSENKEPSYGGSHKGKFCFEKDGCEDGFKGQKLEYDKAVTYGDFVCVSEMHGLTCWNTKTERGVFLSRDHFLTF
ncbi:hypothetical protein JOD50_000677 [Pseudoglutamicibacter cumminsii]|nr:hypothetical protein [Pseudoglutamicibacter cumminsii]